MGKLIAIFSICVQNTVLNYDNNWNGKLIEPCIRNTNFVDNLLIMLYCAAHSAQYTKVQYSTVHKLTCLEADGKISFNILMTVCSRHHGSPKDCRRGRFWYLPVYTVAFLFWKLCKRSTVPLTLLKVCLKSGLRIRSSVFWANPSFFAKTICEWAIRSKNERFAHALIFVERPERFAHGSSFLVSNLSDSLTSLIFGEWPERFAHIAH